ncbi:MAG: polysaccharide deacetylase family protein [Flavipsychrobacter sp.]
MYHRVWPEVNDGLTITPEKLREQWLYLKQAGYNTLSMQEFINIIEHKLPYPPKSLLLTFDDGYKNNLDYVYPLLKELNWQATFFIIASTVYENAEEDAVSRKMTLDELRMLDSAVVQLGLHGYHHEHFSALSNDEIKNVITSSIRVFEKNQLSFFKVLAYPYGDRPKNKKQFDELKAWMDAIGIKAAFRIGNKVAQLPVKDIFEIKRIDIKGTDTMEDFKIKLKKGKLKPF